MNEQEKHLSLAIDALTKLNGLLVGLESIHQSSKVVRLSHEALKHVEAASNMPKPSKIRDLFQRLGRAA